MQENALYAQIFRLTIIEMSHKCHIRVTFASHKCHICGWRGQAFTRHGGNQPTKQPIPRYARTNTSVRSNQYLGTLAPIPRYAWINTSVGQNQYLGRTGGDPTEVFNRGKAPPSAWLAAANRQPAANDQRVRRGSRKSPRGIGKKSVGNLKKSVGDFKKSGTDFTRRPSASTRNRPSGGNPGRAAAAAALSALSTHRDGDGRFRRSRRS